MDSPEHEVWAELRGVLLEVRPGDLISPLTSCAVCLPGSDDQSIAAHCRAPARVSRHKALNQASVPAS